MNVSPASPDRIPWDWVKTHHQELAYHPLFQAWLGSGGQQLTPCKGLGVAPVLFVVPEKERSKYAALRHAFILPLQWFQGDSPDSPHLPQSLHSLAQTVREQVDVQGWFLDFSEVDGWRGQYDLSDWPINVMQPDSGFAILAASLMLAQAGIPLDPNRALATGCPSFAKEKVLIKADAIADKAGVVVSLSKRTGKPVILFAAASSQELEAGRRRHPQVKAIDLSLPIEQALAPFLGELLGLEDGLVGSLTGASSKKLWWMLRNGEIAGLPISAVQKILEGEALKDKVVSDFLGKRKRYVHTRSALLIAVLVMFIVLFFLWDQIKPNSSSLLQKEAKKNNVEIIQVEDDRHQKIKPTRNDGGFYYENTALIAKIKNEQDHAFKKRKQKLEMLISAIEKDLDNPIVKVENGIAWDRKKKSEKLEELKLELNILKINMESPPLSGLDALDAQDRHEERQQKEREKSHDAIKNILGF